ncbi:hypothetical protein [Methylosinus sp. KRF6]|uniref:YkoP family protein n=1 Tax=Methylosinus sp. KRF6 TaxID=2846853 RepID=UPI001C0E0002|nr:hypothetical protein [Methylosinus sp. KRF6]MBU3887880.1 hypothetical protein [Methylosinus sp. KRF6]
MFEREDDMEPSAAQQGREGSPDGEYSLLKSSIRALDAYLRRRQGVYEYSNLGQCLFRVQLVESTIDAILGDGTPLRRGAPILDLHIWNEHVPRTPQGGPNLGWARQLDRCIDASLRELAAHLARNRTLDGVSAVRGNLSLGAQSRSNQIARVASRFGFEQLPTPRLSHKERLHWFGENILISMLVLAENASALHADTLFRCRTLTYISRNNLERRFGGKEQPVA